MKSVTLTVTVKAIGKITDGSDEDVPGTYEVTVPESVYENSKEDACDLALDAFHRKVAIAEVDDFEVRVTGPDGKRLIGNETWDGMSGIHGYFEGKIA